MINRMEHGFKKPEAYEKYYQYLIKEAKIFSTLKDIFMLSLVIGFRNKTRLPFSKSGGDAIKGHIFSEEDANIMDIIAIETYKDLNILLSENQEEKYKMIEEFAHGGIKYIVENVFIGDEITNANRFLEFVCQYSPENSNIKQVDVSSMMSEILADIE